MGSSQGFVTWTEKVVCDFANDLSSVVADAEHLCLHSEPAEVPVQGARNGGLTTGRQAERVARGRGLLERENNSSTIKSRSGLQGCSLPDENDGYGTSVEQTA